MLGKRGEKLVALLTQRAQLTFGLHDLDGRNDLGMLAIEGKLVLLERDARFQFRNLALKAALVVCLNVMLKVGEQVAFLAAFADEGQTALRRFDTSGMAALYAAEAVRVGNDSANELNRARCLAFLGQYRAHGKQVLRRLWHEQGAVEHTLCLIGRHRRRNGR